MENKHKKVVALTETSCSELSTKLIVTVIFFPFLKGAQGDIGFPGLKGQLGAKVTCGFFFLLYIFYSFF